MAVVEPTHERGSEGARRRVRLRSPATFEDLGELELAAPADVRAAVSRAREAQPDWADRGPEGRRPILERAAKGLVARRDELVDRIARETGRARLEVLAHELLPACETLRLHARRARRMLADRVLPASLTSARRLRVHPRPFGVVGVLAPGSFPFALALRPVVQALAAGNAVVLKPSETAPLSAEAAAELLRDAGLPEDLLQVVHGDAEVGAALVEASVDRVAFHGAAESARRVAEACGRRGVPCTLETGGVDPMIVCADADLDRAAAGAVFGAFANSGQGRVAVERVFVVDEVADAFVAKVVEQSARLRQGAGGLFEVGPVASAEHLERVERHVAEALEKGARVLCGGRRNPDAPGLFYEPTVLVDVSPEMAVMREESCGPLLPVFRVPDERAALRGANAVPTEGGASVWTRNRHRGRELATGLRAGCVVLNDCMVGHGAVGSPFGGVKGSGIGHAEGEGGLRSFCHLQSVVETRAGRRRAGIRFPYTQGGYRALDRLMRIVWGTPLGRLLS